MHMFIIFEFQDKVKRTGSITIGDKKVPTYNYLFGKLKGNYYVLLTQMLSSLGEQLYTPIGTKVRALETRANKVEKLGLKVKSIQFMDKTLNLDVLMHTILMKKIGFIDEYIEAVKNHKKGFLTMYGTYTNSLPLIEFYKVYVNYWHNYFHTIFHNYLDDLVYWMVYHPYNQKKAFLAGVEVPVMCDEKVVGYLPLMIMRDYFNEVVYKKSLFTSEFMNKTVLRFFGRAQYEETTSYYDGSFKRVTKDNNYFNLLGVNIKYHMPKAVINRELKDICTKLRFE